MLATQPIVQVIASHVAYLYKFLYLLLASSPSTRSNIFHKSVGIGGLNYISYCSLLILYGLLCHVERRYIQMILETTYCLYSLELQSTRLRVTIL